MWSEYVLTVCICTDGKLMDNKETIFLKDKRDCFG